MSRKIKISGEVAYFSAIILLSLAVAILSAADFGISMIVAPAYLLSLKTSILSFGQAEYVVQACVFALFLKNSESLTFSRSEHVLSTDWFLICGGKFRFSIRRSRRPEV